MNDQPPRDIRDAAPTSLHHVIGQQGVVEQLQVALDAHFYRSHSAFPDCLLVGPPGVGKSQIAQILSEELAAGFFEVLGQTISNMAELNALLLEAKDGDVIHIDEVHLLPKKMQTALYLCLDKRLIQVGSKAGVQSLPVARFTLLASTTDEYGVLQPLRDRMKLTLRFQHYSVEELMRILEFRVKVLGWWVKEEVLPAIAIRSRGTPRLALRLLTAARRCCDAEGADVLSMEHLEKAAAMEGLDSLGLFPQEQMYLRLLRQGPSRLNVIASSIGLPSRTIAEVYEPFLIRIRLITKDNGGRRELTSLGRQHLSDSCQIDDQKETQ